MKRPALGGLTLTALVHAILIAAMVLSHRSSAAPSGAPRNYVVAKLVRLGKPRDPNLLPRIPTAPAPTAPPTSVSPDLEANAQPSSTPKTDPSVKAGEDFDRARLRAMQLGETYEEPEGSPEGSVYGTATSATEGDPYATAIDAAIRGEWRIPDLVRPEQLEHLATTVFLRIQGDGTIIENQLVTPSGNRFFDASVIEAIARVKKLPPPPSDRMDQVLSGGITIVFRP